MIFLVDKNDHNCIEGQVELRKTPVNYYWEEVKHACECIEWKMEGEREKISGIWHHNSPEGQIASGHWGRKNINFLCGPLKAEKYCYIMGEKDCYDLDRYSIVKQATWWYLVKWKAGDEFIVQYLGEKVINVGDRDVISSISMTLRKKGIAIHGDIVSRITWIGHVQRILH